MFFELRGTRIADTDDVWPENWKHRHVSGSHGPGPVMEQHLLQTMYQVTKPTVAFLSGEICDFAIDIAAHCDMRVCADTTTFQDRRIQQGKTASTGISYLLPRLIGLSQANRVLLLGEELTAEAMHKNQFIHELVDEDGFETYTDSFRKKIVAMPTRSWQVHKKQVLPQLDMNHDAAMTHSLGVRQTHVINDRIEGIQAWRERRKPNFRGD